jgi:hypothetical protein
MTSTIGISAIIELVAAIVTVLTAVGTFLVRLRRPKLRLEKFDPSMDVVESVGPITWAPELDNEFWVRLRIVNSAWHPMAQGVLIRLISTQISSADDEGKERDSVTAMPLNLSQRRVLSWADLKDESLNMSPKILQKFDLLWGQKLGGRDDYGLRLNFHDKPTDGRDKLFAGYKYVFVIAIEGSNFAPVLYSIHVSTEKPVSGPSVLHIDISKMRFWQRKRSTPKA